MAFPLLSLLAPLAGPVTEIVKDVLKRVLPPEKMNELDKAQIDQQIANAIMSIDASIFQKQVDVILAEAKGESWLQRSWRPILMLTIVAIVANNYVIYPYLSMFTSRVTMLELPMYLWDLLKIGVGGYVVGRSVEKIAESKWGKKE